MRFVALVILALQVGCAAPPPVVPTPAPTVAPTFAPTVAPTRQTTGSSVAKKVDYKALTQPLLLPLGALIVAVRANTPTTTYWLAQFNTAADGVLQAIDGDESTNANSL